MQIVEDMFYVTKEFKPGHRRRFVPFAGVKVAVEYSYRYSAQDADQEIWGWWEVIAVGDDIQQAKENHDRLLGR